MGFLLIYFYVERVREMPILICKLLRERVKDHVMLSVSAVSSHWSDRNLLLSIK